MTRADTLISNLLEDAGPMTRGWVDPHDNFHDLGGFAGGKFALHNNWAKENSDKTGVSLEDMHKHGTTPAMLKAGWIRVGNYSIETHKNHHERAKKFLKTNYPHGVYGLNVHGLSESDLHEGTGVRGWLDPHDKFHELEPFQLHHAWVIKHKHRIQKTSPGVGYDQDSMLKVGWVRIANNSVDVHEDHHHRALKFLKEYPSDDPPDMYVHKGDGSANEIR